MITFLLVISFLLHFVTLITIVVLSMRVSKTKELELKQEKVARQVEETFTTYLLEIKEENERLMNILEKNGQTEVPEKGESKEDLVYKPKPQDFSESLLDHQIGTNTSPEIRDTIEKKVEEEPSKDDKSDYHKEESYQPSLQSSVFQLYDQGYSTEQIAKQLDCGKTEVDLMLKIHPKMKQ